MAILPSTSAPGTRWGARGEQNHILSINELSTHTHAANATTATSSTPIPSGNILADSPSQLYASPPNQVPLLSATVANVGGSQTHLNICIALQGIFPSPN